MSQVFIISAPSGSGKSTLVQSLLEQEPGLIFSVSYTTRAPRGQEQDGREYHFVSREEFERMIAAGDFIEWARVFDHYYGTHRRYVDQGAAEGRDVVLDIDVQGARQLREKIPGAVSIFILAPSREELEQRLRARGDTSDAVIQSAARRGGPGDPQLRAVRLRADQRRFAGRRRAPAVDRANRPASFFQCEGEGAGSRDPEHIQTLD